MLSTGLAGCAHHPANLPPPPTAVAVNTETQPAADLLVCPAAPEGFPLDQAATMTNPVRSAAIRLAEAYAAVVDQLDRLIEWHDPGACTPAAK